MISRNIEFLIILGKLPRSHKKKNYHREQARWKKITSNCAGKIKVRESSCNESGNKYREWKSHNRCVIGMMQMFLILIP